MTQNNDNDKAAVPGEELVDTSRFVVCSKNSQMLDQKVYYPPF